MKLKDTYAFIKKSKLAISIVVSALIILVNAGFLSDTHTFLGMPLPFFVSPLIGTLTSIVYIVLAGYLVGKVCMSDEREGYIRFVFGVLLLICLLMFFGTGVVLFYRLNIIGLTIMLFGPLAFCLIIAILQRRSGGTEQGVKAQRFDKTEWRRYLSPMHIVFLVLLGYCSFLLVSSRSGWVYGTVWDAVPASFLPTLTLLSLVLVWIILYSETKTFSKVLLTVMYSTLVVMVFAIVLYPGSYGDPAVHLGWARMIVEQGTLRTGEIGTVRTSEFSLWYMYWLIKAKGLALLSALITNMFTVDVFWVHTFIPPVLWGVFIPTITYKIARIVGMREKVCVLAAFISAFYSSLVQWGQRSTANSLGFIPFLLSLYFALWYFRAEKKRMALFLAVFTAIVSSLTHPFTGIIALIFVLVAIGLKRYDAERLHSTRKAYLLMALVLLGSVLVLPGVFALNNIVYLQFAPPDVRARYAALEVISFNIDKLVKTDPWILIFEGFASSSFKDAVISGVILLFGIIGFAYALKKTAHAPRHRVLVMFLFLVFVIHLVYYRVLEYGMTNVPFGPGRMLASRDLVVIPFSALAIYSLVGIFEGRFPKNRTVSLFRSKRLVLRFSVKRILAVLLVGLALSALAVESIRGSYAWLRGLHPTQLEVDAVKFIDEHTNGPYVVIGDPTTAMVGMCFVGLNNKEKWYVFAKGEYFREPSVTTLTSYMRTAPADVGYFIVSTMRNTNFDKAIAEASRVFGLLTILSNDKGGRLYIFKYRVPPLPRSDNVTAFYWETPEGYYVQNNLFRLIISPSDGYIDVRDPRWDVLYESLDVRRTLVDGVRVGNFVSAEYYNPSSGMWDVWDRFSAIPFEEVPSLAQQFRFRLRFDNASLVGVVERGTPYVQMWWEGSEVAVLNINVGDFNRLYIPGLIGGVDSYDVNSREFGLFYTAIMPVSLTDGVVLRPFNRPDVGVSSLTFSDIIKYCQYSATSASSAYYLYLENTADKDRWAYVEVWLPDAVYGGTFPPLSYSADYGKSWVSPITGVVAQPIKTLSEVDVNWVLTVPRTFSETPRFWSFSLSAAGGSYMLPWNYTDTGGAQNRYVFGIYLPAKDKVLLTMGVPTYYVRPLKTTYVFTDSDHISYGLRNMREGLIKFYRLRLGAYVGGVLTAKVPTSLSVVQNDDGVIKSVLLTVPGETVFSFYSASGVDTTIDTDEDGVPDRI